MNTTCFLADLPTWILAVLSGLTLYVLVGYARDTRRIANDSASQVERSQMPFLVLVMKPRTDQHDYYWALENHGFGPALNVRRGRHFPSNPSQVLAMASIAPSRENGERIDEATASEMKTKRFVAEYESLSGKGYRTDVEWVNGEVRSQFIRL